MLPSWPGGRAIAFQAMRLDYHKFVRDGIPRIIEAGGGRPVTRVLDQAEYLPTLWAKLVDEAEEAQAAPHEQLMSELADVLEVLQALAAAHDMRWEDIVWGSALCLQKFLHALLYRIFCQRSGANPVDLGTFRAWRYLVTDSSPNGGGAKTNNPLSTRTSGVPAALAGPPVALRTIP